MTEDHTPSTPARDPGEAAQKRLRRAEEPSFLDDLEASWGAPWGASDEVGQLRQVVVRRPGNELDVIDPDAWDPDIGALIDPNGMWYWTERQPPRLGAIQEDHRQLVETLRAEGVDVNERDPMGGRFVKAMYIRDPFLMLPGGAIVGRMAVRMRRGEERDVTRLLGELGIPILGTVTGSGTIEGGSFMKLGPRLAALGTSVRCNADGARQLEALLRLQGVELITVPLPGYSIHLDVHMGMVDLDKALVDMVGLPYTFMEQLRSHGVELIEADPGERPWALNLLCLRPGRVLMAAGAPRTEERLRERGVEVVTIAFDEVHKNGGGIHCCTNELIRSPA